MIIGKLANLRISSVFFLFIVLLSLAGVLAAFAFPGATSPNSVLVSQACAVENNSGISEGFGGVCSSTTSIDTNNAVIQSASVNGNNQFMGIRTSNYNSSVSNCGGITNVKVCYEWWSSSSSIGTCSVSVDAHAGGSYQTASSVCPGTTANPGEICTDVTSIENWSCDSFFTASGSRAIAYLQVASTTGGAKTLSVDDLYFNVTYTPDAIPPSINVVYPLNTTYTSNVTSLNVTVSDNNLASCWYNGNGTNISFSCTSGVQVNITSGLTDSVGSHTWYVYANDSYGNNASSSLTFFVNLPPTISNITVSPNPSGISTSLNITANSVNDSNLDTLQFYCSDSFPLFPVDNSMCSSGNVSNLLSPYSPYCTYTPNKVAGNYTIYCRMYDGVSYSNKVNYTYTVLGSSMSTSVVSVAGRTIAPYYDNVNDLFTLINISGQSGMSCRWSSSDSSYSSMSSGHQCSISGIYAACNVSDVVSQGATTRYVSCKDSYGNEQTASDNLNVDFTLDYTAPTTSDNSVSSVQLPGYAVTISEADNVDSDPKTYYCTDSTNTCTPSGAIDNLGQINFLVRGTNYLRYFSSDYSGNNQTLVSKTIKINQLPVFSSATDNAATILGGTTVSISTVSSDSDSGQTIKLYVCNQSGISNSGCTYGTYCFATAIANLSCGFASESDSATHNWYAYILDALNESATANPLTGSYTTDSTGPTITIISPTNTSFSSVNISAEIATSEASASARYSLDGTANVSMTNLSSTSFIASLNNLAYGLHNITFYANDSFGNFGSSVLRYFTIQTPVDITAPSLTFVSPSNASYTNPSGTYVNVSSDEDLVWAGYRLNGGSLLNLTSATARVWYVNLTSLSQETNYTITVYGNDSSANQGNRTIVFYADSLAPRYSSVSAPSTNQSLPVNCSIYWNDTYNINSVIISENSLGSFENHTISFSGNSGLASYVIVGSKLANAGNYVCRFYAADVAGNTNFTSASFSVSDVTAPSITVTSPTNGGVYNQVDILFSFISNENLSAGWYHLNSTGFNYSMGNTSPTNWNATFTGVSGQAYSIVFYGNDSSGNLGVSSAVVFSINTGAGDLISPVVTINSIANASYKSLSGVALNVSVNENVSWVKYSLNGSANISLTNTTLLNWNATLPDLAQESTNSLVVYANDSSGNIGSSSIIFYADTLAPRFSSVSATSVNETQNANCTAYINDSFALSSVKISEDATTPMVFMNHTIDLSSTGYANYTIINVQKGSDYTCRFYATDAAGNTDSTSTTFDVNDVTAPVLTINSPIAQNYSTSSILFSLTTNEEVVSVNYSLDGGTTNVSLTGSGVSWSKTSTLADGSYTVIFYAIDSSGNLGIANVSIVVDTTVNDLVAPVITVLSPLNNSYDLDGSVLLNISTNEDLSWAGYNNGSGIFNLGNTSLRNWNATISLAEGVHNIIFYANDTSSNKNQGNRTVVVSVDLNNPSVNSFNCDNTVNDSKNLTCNASFSDAVGLDYAILSNNFSGSFVNGSQIDLSGTADSINYLFTQGNYTPGVYSIQVYLFDLAGRVNDSVSRTVTVLDDRAPSVSEIIYSPNTSDELDPGVDVTINATVSDNYLMGSAIVYYKNISDSSWSTSLMTNNSLTNYNTSIVFAEGNWTFYVNASDAQGNTNISSNYTLGVYPDVSQAISTNITVVKSFTYTERSSSNELGYIILNTTSDTSLNYNVSISASADIVGRFNLNNTLNQTENYSASSGDVLYLPLYVNLTGLTSALYPYNITVRSEAGTVVIERNLNVQTASGPYLSVSIDTYSSSVTRGQGDLDFVVSVTNLGTADAHDVYLSWSLPSGFDLTSGILSRYLGTVPVGVSGTNSIKINVSSSISGSIVNVSALANSSNADSASDLRNIRITNPLTITQTVVQAGGGGTISSQAGGGGGAEIVYSKIIDVVRGEGGKLDLVVQNNRSGASLQNLSLNLTGYLSQYMDFYPSIIKYLGPNSNGSFTVTLKVPSYKEAYEEYNVTAHIRGQIVYNQTVGDYTETQYIKLIIQEVSYEVASNKLFDAEKALKNMTEHLFNVVNVQSLFDQAKSKLDIRRNKESFDLSSQVIDISKMAFTVNDLIARLVTALNDPAKTNLIVGNVAREVNINNQSVSSFDYVTGKAVFASQDVQEIIDLASAAFERGDYELALERARQAQVLLVLERKGNVGLFFYLYWQYVLVALILLSFVSIVGFRAYKKNSISQKIEDLNKEEKTIGELRKHSQKLYLSGRKSAHDYHDEMNRYQKRIANIKKSRVNLRNNRIKLLSAQQVSKDLELEAKQVESEIVRLQENYFKKKLISKAEYDIEFEMYTERLAEIENEKTTLHLVNNQDKYEGKYLQVATK
ncbi:Uncharacterised protein [uncultured archaeon]|nr:Uncharacterised protein [uncultured archaeon]